MVCASDEHDMVVVERSNMTQGLEQRTYKYDDE